MICLQLLDASYRATTIMRILSIIEELRKTDLINRAI